MRKAFYILTILLLLPACGQKRKDDWLSPEEAFHAFFLAVESGKLVEVKELLTAGFDVNTKDVYGRTALHIAILKRNVPLVRVLVASSADVNAADNEGYTPLDYAVDYTSSTEIRSILDEHGAKLKQPHRDEIIDAAAKGDLDRLKKLLAQGIDLQVNSIYQDTPLHAAAENGWKEVVKFLIRNGAEVNSKNRLLGGTPLYYASNTQVATLLIESGADVNREHTYCHTSSIVSETVLHKAVRDGNKQMVELLISKGARLDSVNPIWGTPLHVAARFGKLEAASILIAKGADVNAVGGFLKQTPLDLTKTDEMKQLLCRYGALTAEELKQKQ